MNTIRIVIATFLLGLFIVPMQAFGAGAASSVFRDTTGFIRPLIITDGAMFTASSSIGNGTQTGGLTVSGGATTTGIGYFASQVGVGTSTPSSLFKTVVEGNVWITGINGPVGGNNTTVIGKAYTGSTGVLGTNISDTLSVGTSSVVISTGGLRAGLFNAYYEGPGSATGGIAQGLNGNAVMGASTTGNLTSVTANGGPIRNRYQAVNISTGYNLALSSALSAVCVVNGTLASSTSCASFHAELPTIGAGNLMTNNMGLWVRGGTPTGTLTNRYGVYIDDLVGGTNRYGIYQAGLSDRNYFNGNTGIGSTTPYARLSLAGSSLGTTNLFSVSTSTAAATSTVFIIDPNGKIGIGTSSPAALFTVESGGAMNNSYFTGSVDSFLQSTYQNRNSGSTASTDLIVCNDLAKADGACSTYYGDFGVNSSTYSQAGFTGETANDVYLTASDGALDLGTASTTGTFPIRFFVGGLNANNVAGVFGSTGNFGVGSSSPFAKLSVHAKATDTNGTLFAVASSTATATTTLFSVNNVGTTTIGLFGACNTTRALTTDAAGNVSCGAISSGSAFPFTPSTNYNALTNATGTPVWFQAGMQASSTSHFAALDIATPLAISSGGTATSTFRTNGLAYYDNTNSRLTNSSGLTFDGSTFTIGSNPTDVRAFNISGTQTLTTANIPAIDMGMVVNYTGGTAHQYFTLSPTFRPTSAITTLTVIPNTMTVDDSAGSFADISSLRGMNLSPVLSTGYGGTITQYQGMFFNNPTVTNGQLLNNYPIFITNQTNASTTVGIVMGDLTSSVGNISLLTGLTTPPTVNADLYLAADYPSFFVATGTATTNDKIVLKSSRAGLTTGHQIGGIAFWSDDTNLTAPGLEVAGIQALVEATHTAATQPTSLTFSTTADGGTATSTEKLRITGQGKVGIGTTSPWAMLSIHHPATGDANPIFAIASSTATATTTLFSISNTGAIQTVLADGCVQAASGILTSTGSACGSGGGSVGNWFTPNTNYNVAVNSTSTPIWFTAGLMASSTSYFGSTGQLAINSNGTVTSNATTFSTIPYASTTAITASGQFFGNTSDLVTTPAYSWGGDTTTGIYNSAASQVGIAGAGLQMANFKAGTTTLNIYATNGTLGEIRLGRTDSATRYNTIRSMVGTTVNDNFIDFYLHNLNAASDYSSVNSILKLGGNGRVGISSTTPLAKLSIHANDNDGVISRNLFRVASSTATATTTLFNIDNTGVITSTAAGTSTFSNTIQSTCFTTDGSTCITAGGGGSTVTNVGTSTTADVQYLTTSSPLSLVAGDTVNIFWTVSTSAACGTGAGSFIRAKPNYKLSTHVASTSIGTFIQGGNSNGCVISGNFPFTATTTVTLWPEVVKDDGNLGPNYVSITAQKVH